MDLHQRLQLIQSQELSYSKLCKALELPTKAGDSKVKQFNDLQCYCQIEKLSSPTRYVVTEVYDGQILGILSANSNKFQLFFDSAMYKAALANRGQPLYLSHTDVLKLFEEVNDNFSYACDIEKMAKIGEEYVYMVPMSQTVYKILWRWNKRRLEQMNARGVILLGQGYRLYIPKWNANGDFYKDKHNVPYDSDEEKICQEIYNQAVREIMPADWKNHPVDDDKKYSDWVPEWLWAKFERRIAELTRERFNGKYIDMRQVITIRLPSEDWIRGRLEELYKEISDISTINIEAQRKVLTTKQLSEYTEQQRQKFTDCNMAKDPPIRFRDEINKNKKEEG